MYHIMIHNFIFYLSNIVLTYNVILNNSFRHYSGRLKSYKLSPITKRFRQKKKKICLTLYVVVLK